MKTPIDRAVQLYDLLQSTRFAMREYRAREHAVDALRGWAGVEWIRASEILADALARRAADKLKP